MSGTADFEDIERRAKAAGLTIDQLCERAEVHRSSYQRWKADKIGPTMRKWNALMAALKAAEAGRAKDHASPLPQPAEAEIPPTTQPDAAKRPCGVGGDALAAVA